MGIRLLEIVLLLEHGDRLSDVYIRQILTINVNPRAVRVKQQYILLTN